MKNLNEGTLKNEITGRSKSNACFFEGFKRSRIGKKLAAYGLSYHGEKHSPLDILSKHKKERHFLPGLKAKVSVPAIE